MKLLYGYMASGWENILSDQKIGQVHRSSTLGKYLFLFQTLLKEKLPKSLPCSQLFVKAKNFRIEKSEIGILNIIGVANSIAS